jgi:hypothetical protein
MVSQTEVNGRRSGESAAGGMRDNVMSFAHDLWSLAELQIQLFFIDFKEALSRSAVPLALLLAATALAFAAIPLAVWAIVWLLINKAGFSEQAAFSSVALASAIVAGLVGWLGWRQLKKALAVLRRSRDEMRENLNWVKRSLQNRNSN